MNLPQPIPNRRLFRGPALLLVAILAFPLAARGDYAYLLPLGQLCAIYGIIVTGLTLLMGFTGQISLGHAGFYGFGAYVGAVAATAGRLPLAAAMGVAVAAGALLALAAGFAVLRLHGHHLALATLCLGVILGEFINKAQITGGAGGMFDLPELTLAGLVKGSAAGKFYLAWAVAWLVVLWAVQLTASPVGRALRAIQGDEAAAAAAGIPVFWIKLKVFAISGALAALAGTLYAFVYTPSYLGPEEFSLMFSVTLVTMAVIGGMGNVWGGLAGAAVMTSLHELITLGGEKLGIVQVARWEQLIFGLLLALILIFCPEGLMPALGGWARRAGAWWGRRRKMRTRLEP